MIIMYPYLLIIDILQGSIPALEQGNEYRVPRKEMGKIANMDHKQKSCTYSSGEKKIIV